MLSRLRASAKAGSPSEDVNQRFGANVPVQMFTTNHGISLAQRIRCGDRAARRRLTEANLGS